MPNETALECEASQSSKPAKFQFHAAFMTNITGALSPTDLKEFQLQGSIMPGLWSLNLDLTIATKQPKIEMFFAAYKGRVRGATH
jgi:hypothetical protein